MQSAPAPADTPQVQHTTGPETRRRTLALGAVAVGGAVLGTGLLAGGRSAAAVAAVGFLAAVALLLLRLLLDGRNRAVWGCFAAGAALLVLGQLTVFAGSGWSAAPRTYGFVDNPLLVAGLSLGFPLLFVGHYQLLRQQVARLLPGGWLDAPLSLAVLVAFCLAVVDPAVRRTTGLDPLASVALVLRPALDLLLISFAVAVRALTREVADPRAGLLVLSYTALGVADTVGVLRVCGLLDGPLADATPVAVRLTAVLLLVVVAWCPETTTASKAYEGIGVLAGPITVLLGGTALLAVAGYRDVPAASVVLALAAVVGVAVKVVLVVREVMRLADDRRLARTDDTTGLPNARALHAWLRDVVAREERAVVLVLDVADFTDVNGAHGRHVGDSVLRAVGQRAADALPTGAPLARLGGDEFVAVLRGLTLDSARVVADRVRDAVARPLDVVPGLTEVCVTVGAAAWPTPRPCLAVPTPEEPTPADEELLRHAVVAAQLAATTGTGWAVYDASVDDAARERRALAAELHEALREGQLVVHYQPQLDLRSGQVAGVEALVRWQHPERGLLAPVAFLDLAEEEGVMADVTMAVLEASLADAARWREDLQTGGDAPPLRLAVNLSTSCLLNPALPGFVRDVLDRHAVRPERLVLEITETTLMRDPERSRATIEQLLATGVAVSIDDYGTGYSSLAYLQDLPAVELKLDRSFTARLAQDARTAAIIASTTDLAHSLGLRLLAEGVEDAETLARLAEMGVDETQGYFHARPMPAADAVAWLRGHDPSSVTALTSRGPSRTAETTPSVGV